MTFVSYAQNFEDVLLWRALGTVGPGFYIDIGAAHPDADSVTRAFYDRGWHGINAEPVAASFHRLHAARPRDINLRVAVGERPGEAAFFELDGADAGRSTLDPAVLAPHAGLDPVVRQTTVAVETLATICDRHAPADIHFLKVDVEGAERAVLAGADFARHRPWIVLVEATAPLTAIETHAEWESILLGAAYRFVWFDGLNRFYVAAERHADLARHFQAPPNVFDDFLRAADTEVARRIHQAETRAATLDFQVAAAQRRADAIQAQSTGAFLRLARTADELANFRQFVTRREAHLAQLEAGLAQSEGRLAHALAERDLFRARADLAAREHQAAAAWVGAMQASTSWRITAPLRRVKGARAPDPEVTSPPPEAEPPPAPDPVATPPAEAPARGPLRVVHQFHSGSAYGDAVTNAMFTTRTLLRRMGYDSRIYAEHLDPRLGHEIHAIDELPAHSDYALMVHHSMGHDALGRILALPAPKILVYHNITPPELLQDLVLQRYARIGREQLLELRPAVAAALADSEYNALDLRAAGFTTVASCPMLFDVDAMLARAAAHPPTRGTVFTMLFVGRIAESKGQRELVDAYARFCADHPGPSRLVLVGRHVGDPYAEELAVDIRNRDFGHGEVQLTGLVPDAELLDWYRQADLYISLSRHEGFGVPLVEAMAYGVPVLAWPSGAVPYTLGGTAALLLDTTAAGVADHMLALARDPARRAAVAERQRRSLGRFALDRQAPALKQALARAGVEAPVDLDARDTLAANLRFSIAGHVNGTYSLAEINRSIAAAIDAARPGTVRLLPVEGRPTVDLSDVPPEQRQSVDALVARPKPDTGPVVSISHHYPVWVPGDPGDLGLALFYWEESLVPTETVAVLNQHFRGVLAPSLFVAKALVDSGVTVPVRVVGHVPRLDPYRAIRAGCTPRIDRPFTFLHVSSLFPRKGADALLSAYARAFRNSDRVRLVIKGFPNPHNDVAGQLARLRAADPGLPDVELIDQDMPEAELLDLFREADAVVLPSRGEGYNLPAAEAMAAGIPLIVTGLGGHTDFAAGPGVRLLNYRFEPSRSHLATAHSVWAEPDVDDLAAALREAAEQPPIVPAEPELGLSDFPARLARTAADLLLTPSTRALDAAWITSWDVRCGVAEYSSQLIDALPQHPAVILADQRSSVGPRVDAAWRAGDAGSLPGLLSAILVRDPNAVVIQHQPGLLTWPTLAALLTAPALVGRVACVTLHSTRNLLDQPAELRHVVLQALAAASRVVVHTLADLNRLRQLGLAANVTMVPHGVGPAQPPPVPQQLGPGQPVLIGCYGFFLPGKGIPQLIEAMRILRRSWPGARLRLVNAAYDAPESRAEIDACRTAAAEAGLAEVIEFITDFLPHERSASLLRECDIVVLPYQASQESSSAAVRSALRSGRPVLVTPLPLFDEMEDAVIRLPGRGPTDIAQGLMAALQDQAARTAVTDAAQTWIADRSWDGIARRWDGMLRGLLASGVTVSQCAMRDS